MEARAAEAEQRAPLAVLVDGGVTQYLADQRRGGPVVLSFDQLARPRHYARPDQFQPHRLQPVLLGGGEDPRLIPAFCHAARRWCAPSTSTPSRPGLLGGMNQP